MGLTFHQLRIFSAVANHRNVSRAAWDLHISQPSLSQQLKLLEKDLGLKLYRKISGGIELTREGAAFLRDTEPILLRVETLKKKLGTDQAGGRADSLLSVGGSYTPSTSFLPLLVEAFKKTHPCVNLILRTDKSPVIEKLVLKSEVGIGVIVIPSYSPLLTYEPYRQMQMVAFVSAKHPLAKKQPLTAAELCQFPFVILKSRKSEQDVRSSKIEQCLKEIERQGFKPDIFMMCDSSQAVKAAVRSGVGVGLLYKDTLEPELREDKLKVIKFAKLKAYGDSFVVYHKEKPLSLPARDFLALLRESRKGLE